MTLNPSSEDHAARADIGLPWLVADLGGTNARFALVTDPALGPSHLRTLPVRDHADLGQAIRHYLNGIGAESAGGSPVSSMSPRRAALAMAASPTGDTVRFTNSPWAFSRSGLQQALGLDELLLLNDFEALALSLPRLGPSQTRPIDDVTVCSPAPSLAAPKQPAPMAVLGPGTGLGVGSVVPTAQGWVALPCEGGHVTLAPFDDFESELLRHARRSFPHVSAERFLSGVGLPTLHAAVAAVLGAPAPVASLDAPRIIDAALADDPLCVRTIDTFCAMLGGAAGNVALTVGARGGVFIGGGIVPRLGARFFASDFRKRFDAKGRFAAYTQQVPTRLITDTQAALTGAALALEQRPA